MQLEGKSWWRNNTLASSFICTPCEPEMNSNFPRVFSHTCPSASLHSPDVRRIGEVRGESGYGCDRRSRYGHRNGAAFICTCAAAGAARRGGAPGAPAVAAVPRRAQCWRGLRVKGVMVFIVVGQQRLYRWRSLAWSSDGSDDDGWMAMMGDEDRVFISNHTRDARDQLHSTRTGQPTTQVQGHSGTPSHCMQATRNPTQSPEPLRIAKLSPWGHPNRKHEYVLPNLIPNDFQRENSHAGKNDQ